MLDQSFSVENFKRIIDSENRKGVYLEGRFFSDIAEINNKIRTCESDEKRKELINEKDEKLNIALNKICQKVTAPDFKIELEKRFIRDKDKPVYVTEDSPECYFAIKQVQKNIYKLYSVKQTNRNVIISQLINLLEDRMPKCVIRIDLKDFYESIPQVKLFNKIFNENLLNPLSKKIIRNILDSYNKLCGNEQKIGIPRGVGISAYLSELYMEDIDNHINNMEDLVYYARYVDDMVLIFSPTANRRGEDYYKKIEEIVNEKYKLNFNKDKQTIIELFDKNNSNSNVLEYLGYKITFGMGVIITDLTENKINKYKDRIEKAIDHYRYFRKINEKKARKLLERRIRFLTGNTRLVNNKRNILIGIYFSNQHLTEIKNLEEIDKYLKDKINSFIKLPKLKERLQKNSFVTGFKTKRFSPFRSNELIDIMDIWK